MRFLEGERGSFTQDSPAQLAKERRVFFAAFVVTLLMGFVFRI